MEPQEHGNFGTISYLQDLVPLSYSAIFGSYAVGIDLKQKQNTSRFGKNKLSHYIALRNRQLPLTSERKCKTFIEVSLQQYPVSCKQ